MNTQSHVNPWMTGFKIISESSQNPPKSNMDATIKRRAVEDHQERMEHKKQLAEWGLA